MSRISVGRHGERALEAMFKLGGLSADQLAELIDVPRRTASSTLRMLEDSGLTDKTPDLARWQASTGGRPPEFYYLSNRYGGKGITYGGYLAGVERDRDAKMSYKLHQLPARAAHSSLLNTYYLRLLAGAEGASAEVPYEEMWAESHPDHPLLAGEADRGKDERSNSRKSYRRLYPDGSFEVSFEGGEFTTVMVEVETATRGRKLVSKVNDYAGYQHRTGVVRPLIILGRTRTNADSMRRLLRGGLRAGAEEARHYEAWVTHLRSAGASGGNLIAVSSVEEVRHSGPYSGIYRLLSAGKKNDSGRERVPVVSLKTLAQQAQNSRGKLEAKEVA